MSIREHRFTVEGTPHLSVRMPIGDVRIIEGAPGEVLVQLDGRDTALARFIVEQRGDEIVVEPDGPSRGWRSNVDLTIRVGAAPGLTAKLAASDLKVSTSLHYLSVESASGDITVGAVEGDVTIRTASGDVRIGDVGGALEVSTASGDLRAGLVGGSVVVRTASGDVRLEAVGDECTAKSVSGDISLGTFTGPWLDIKSMSGDAIVGVNGGCCFDVDFQTMSGEVRTDFPVSDGPAQGPSARLAIKTISGDVEIRATK